MKISVITPTHDRPESLGRLQRYIKRQTVQPDEWIVACDGPKPPAVDSALIYRGHQEPGYQSLINNLRAALIAASGDVIIIMEDDDWYRADHIEVTANALRHHSATGHGLLRYYNLRFRGWREMKNRGSALCQTGLRRDLVDTMHGAIDEAEAAADYCIDGRFWRRVSHDGLHDQPTVIGIKGVPGTTGLGIGHRAHGWRRDPMGRKLREWIGSDASIYLC